MRTYVFLVIAGMLAIIGMLTYPYLNELIGGVETTGFLPLTKAAVIITPYVFLGFVVFLIFQMEKR